MMYQATTKLRSHPCASIATAVAFFLVLPVCPLRAQETPPAQRENAVAAAAQGAPPVRPANADPGPTPAPTPLLSPAQTTPFSLNDCRQRINQALDFLSDPAATSGEQGLPTRRAAYTLADRVINYLEVRDYLHTSLAHYTWSPLDSNKVENLPNTVDTDTFDFKGDIPHISALSFEIEDGDAFLHTVRVYDENDNVWEHQLEPPVLLQHSLPRREVFHLWRRTTLRKVEVEYSRANPGTREEPRVHLWGGVTDRKEHIKTALYHLRMGREAVREGNVEEARTALAQADRFIGEFIRSNQIQ